MGSIIAKVKVEILALVTRLRRKPREKNEDESPKPPLNIRIKEVWKNFGKRLGKLVKKLPWIGVRVSQVLPQQSAKPVKKEEKKKVETSREKRAKAKAAAVAARKKLPISERVELTHIQMEPLCCSSSCLIRGGCQTLMSIQSLCIAASTAAAIYSLYSVGVWNSDSSGYIAILHHSILQYLILFINAVIVCGILYMIQGLSLYNYMQMKRSLYFNMVILVLALVGLIIVASGVAFFWNGCHNTDFIQVGCCCMLTFVQPWGFFVIYDTMKYFKLCKSMVNMAEFGGMKF